MPGDSQPKLCPPYSRASSIKWNSQLNTLWYLNMADYETELCNQDKILVGRSLWNRVGPVAQHLCHESSYGFTFLHDKEQSCPPTISTNFVLWESRIPRKNLVSKSPSSSETFSNSQFARTSSLNSVWLSLLLKKLTFTIFNV